MKITHIFVGGLLLNTRNHIVRVPLANPNTLQGFVLLDGVPVLTFQVCDRVPLLDFQSKMGTGIITILLPGVPKIKI